MRAYLAEELNVDRPTPYRAVANAQWTYDLRNNALLNPAAHLGEAMRDNPAMRLFVGSAYYDFSSPVASAFYNIGHAGVPMDRVTKVGGVVVSRRPRFKLLFGTKCRTFPVSPKIVFLRKSVLTPVKDWPISLFAGWRLCL